jgi:adenine phosphoribosyltransferase
MWENNHHPGGPAKFSRPYYKDYIRDIPDWPKPGVLFRDITPLLGDPSVFRTAVDVIARRFSNEDIVIVVGIEARGFVIGAALSYALGTGFVPIRKTGKLPSQVLSSSYIGEYNGNILEMHSDAIANGQRVLLVDDLIATGGSAAAAHDLIIKAGGIVVCAVFLVELTELSGRSRLNCPVYALVQY